MTAFRARRSNAAGTSVRNRMRKRVPDWLSGPLNSRQSRRPSRARYKLAGFLDAAVLRWLISKSIVAAYCPRVPQTRFHEADSSSRFIVESAKVRPEFPELLTPRIAASFLALLPFGSNLPLGSSILVETRLSTLFSAGVIWSQDCSI